MIVGVHAVYPIIRVETVSPISCWRVCQSITYVNFKGWHNVRSKQENYITSRSDAL